MEQQAHCRQGEIRRNCEYCCGDGKCCWHACRLPCLCKLHTCAWPDPEKEIEPALKLLGPIQHKSSSYSFCTCVVFWNCLMLCVVPGMRKIGERFKENSALLLLFYLYKTGALVWQGLCRSVRSGTQWQMEQQTLGLTARGICWILGKFKYNWRQTNVAVTTTVKQLQPQYSSYNDCFRVSMISWKRWRWFAVYEDGLSMWHVNVAICVSEQAKSCGRDDSAKKHVPWKRKQQGSCGLLVLWPCNPLVLWSCGSLVLWSCALVRWSSGPLVLSTLVPRVRSGTISNIGFKLRQNGPPKAVFKQNAKKKKDNKQIQVLITYKHTRKTRAI